MLKKILVVDDDPDIREALTVILESQGYQVVTAQDGSEGLAALKEEKPNLMILDLLMPEMDGWDTVREIVDQGFLDGIIICMLTGKEVPDQKMDKLKEYVLDYITKPLQRDTLVSIVKEYLLFLK